MTSLKLKEAAEVVGIVAIVVSLIFVGLEVRQSAAATRGATQQALAAAARDASEALVADQETADLTLRFLRSDDWSDFSEVERFQIVILFTTMLRVYESAHYQWRESMPGLSKYWDERQDYFDESFQRYFESLMSSTADSPSLGRR